MKGNEIKDILKSYDRNKTLSYLKDMIRIPSLSNEEGKLARYIGDKLRELGVKIKRQKILEDSENVYAVIKGSGSGPNIMLAGHTDTIAPLEGWSSDPYEPVEKGDRVYGLGAADMKAGLAVILTLADIITERKLSLKGDLILVFAADEEGHSKGIKKFLETGMKADAAFMIEPNFNSAIVGAVGKMLINCQVKGKACHAAYPQEGVNAIEEAARFVGSLRDVETPGHDKIKAQPYVTLKMKGGYEFYSITVPDSCSFTLNKHTVPGETEEIVLTQLKKLKNTLNLKADFDFEIGEPFYHPYAVDENLKYLKVLREIYRDTVGRELEMEYSNGVSDSNCLVGIGGIPTVNFGPAGGPIHAPDEWVSKTQLFTTVEIYLKLISKFIL